MKTKSLLLLGGVGITAWWVFKKYLTVTNLNFVPAGVGFNGSSMTVQVAVQNPTSDTITMQSFAGNLVVDGSPVANVSSFTPVIVAPNAATPLQFNVQPNWLGIAGQVRDIIQNGFGAYKVQLIGTANANNTPIPINITF